MNLSNYPMLRRVVELHAKLNDLSLVDGWQKLDIDDANSLSAREMQAAETDAADFADKPVRSFIESPSECDALENIVDDPESTESALLIESTMSFALRYFVFSLAEGDLSTVLFR